jgi:hypothetical protein
LLPSEASLFFFFFVFLWLPDLVFFSFLSRFFSSAFRDSASCPLQRVLGGGGGGGGGGVVVDVFFFELLFLFLLREFFLFFLVVRLSAGVLQD